MHPLLAYLVSSLGAGPTGSNPCGIGLCCPNDGSCVYDFDTEALTCCERSQTRPLHSCASLIRCIDERLPCIPIPAVGVFTSGMSSPAAVGLLYRSSGLRKLVRWRLLPDRLDVQHRHRAPERDQSLLCALFPAAHAEACFLTGNESLVERLRFASS